MSNIVLTKQHLREVLVFCFKCKKSRAEVIRMFIEVHNDNPPIYKLRRKWFQCLKNDDFNVEDEPCPGQPRKIRRQNWTH